PLTAPKKNGGRSANINSCATNKHCAFRQFSVPKPPLLLAATRCVTFFPNGRKRHKTGSLKTAF
ncbi:hypothetical protein, partial [Flavobacterium psychrophilum]|uniref:hypothetical protein n=1 Tax=Flavobacterium psychrophilum TaxID=96345 RepID=UPI001ABCA091